MIKTVGLVACVLVVCACSSSSNDDKDDKASPGGNSSDNADIDTAKTEPTPTASIDAMPRPIDAAAEPDAFAHPEGKALALRDEEGYLWVSAPGLPAVSEDGGRVAFVHIENDGGRGAPPRNVHIRDARTNKIIEVVELEGTIADMMNGHAEDKLRAGIEPANARLAKEPWLPMTVGEDISYDDWEDTQTVQVGAEGKAGSLALVYSHPTIHITRGGKDAGKITVGKQWTRKGPNGKRAANIAEVHYHPESGAVLLEIVWPGTHEYNLGNAYVVFTTE